MASRPLRAPRALSSDEGGFSLVETIVAMGIFAVLAVGFAGTMASSLHAQLVSRSRTSANQLATQQVERIRALAYDDVGVVGGNPVGTIAATEPVTVGDTTYLVATDVVLVRDHVETAADTQADYKRVIVTVTREGGSTNLARLRTLVAPPTQPSLTKAVVQAQVVDASDVTVPVAGITVQLTGPAPTRSGITDAQGYVTFAALPPTGAGQTYSIKATSFPPTWSVPDAVQVAAETSSTVVATQTKLLRLRASRVVPVQVSLRDSLGSGFANADITVTSSQPVQWTHTTTGTATFGLLSGVPYTIAAADQSNGWFSGTVVLTPTTATNPTQVLTLTSWPTSPVTVTLTKPGGGAATGVRVRVKGGPRGVLVSATTDGAGVARLDVPTGVGYTVEVDASSSWAAASASVAAGNAVTIPLVAP